VKDHHGEGSSRGEGVKRKKTLGGEVGKRCRGRRFFPVFRGRHARRAHRQDGGNPKKIQKGEKLINGVLYSSFRKQEGFIKPVKTLAREQPITWEGRSNAESCEGEKGRDLQKAGLF